MVPLLTAGAALGIVITAAYILWKMMMHLFMGQPVTTWGALADLQPFEALTMAPLLFLMVGIGLYPAPILNLIGAAPRLLLARA